jgi:hypothetical protein
MSPEMYSAMDALGRVQPRKPPPDPATVTTIPELEAVIWEAMRGMQSTLGSAPRRERVAEILIGCLAYTATQTAATPGSKQ